MSESVYERSVDSSRNQGGTILYPQPGKELVIEPLQHSVYLLFDEAEAFLISRPVVMRERCRLWSPEMHRTVRVTERDSKPPEAVQTAPEAPALPQGVRRHGNGFQANKRINGRRIQKTFPTPELAAEWRAAA